MIAATLTGLLADRDDLALVVLFGSLAKGNGRAGSDVDLAVLPTSGLSSADENELVTLLSHATGREIDLLRLDRIADVVLRREISRGAPVRQRTPGMFARFAAEAALAWLDLEPVYLDAQSRYLRRVAACRR